MITNSASYLLVDFTGQNTWPQYTLSAAINSRQFSGSVSSYPNTFIYLHPQTADTMVTVEFLPQQTFDADPVLV